MSPILLLCCGTVIVVGGILWLRMHAFLALVLGAYLVALLTPAESLRRHAEGRLAKGELTAAAAKSLPARPAAARVAQEFGRTCGSVGILIAMAAIIGECLLRSGAAESIAAATLHVTGVLRAQWAFFFTSYLLAIPVFFDTVFYLMVPLAKAMARHTRRDYLLYIMCIVAGGTITHSLVPPTPGPLFVAVELKVPIATMIGMGTLIGTGACLFGYFFATLSNRRFTIAVPEDVPATPQPAAPRALPPLWLALTPVLLPITLIALDAVLSPMLKESGSAWLPVLKTIGDKDMALTLGAVVALLALARQQNRDETAGAVQAALTSGAMILIITAAGGAFGGVLGQTGVAEAFSGAMAGSTALALPAVFLVTALVRTAQGSATVAMITAAPIAKALLESGASGIAPVYFALAIGCGSKPFPWMNDSGFWVITRLSGMRESETLRTVSPMMSLQGVAGLVLTMLAAWLFPMT